MSLRQLIAAAALLALGACNPPHLGWDPDLGWDEDEDDAEPSPRAPAPPFRPSGVVAGRGLLDLEAGALRRPPLPAEVHVGAARLLAWHFSSPGSGVAYLRDSAGGLVLRWEGEGYRALRRYAAPPFAPALGGERAEDLRHLARSWPDGGLLVAGTRAGPGGATTLWAYVEAGGATPREYAFDLPAASLLPSAHGAALALVGAN